jgi:hypothetical protein
MFSLFLVSLFMLLVMLGDKRKEKTGTFVVGCILFSEVLVCRAPFAW